ncbi:MAG: hypothetical protein KF865_08215 [Bdellovibrionaceae bacterium]|nr:hypothetical protein [Pseudobdellovibrionaceae bacterium]
MKTKSVFLTMFLSVAPIAAQAQVPPICNDLARISCAPGTHKDATGEVISSSTFQKKMADYAEKSRGRIEERFKKYLDDPEKSYFKDQALAAFGLKKSPQCLSESSEDQKSCNDNLLDALTTLTQRQIMGSMMPMAGITQGMNLKEISYVMQSHEYQTVVSDLSQQGRVDLLDAKMEKKIQDRIFPDIKALIAQRIGQLSIPDAQKKFMIGKIKGIRFDGSDCSDMTPNATQGLSPLLTPNAFYNPTKNIFKYCSGFSQQSNSEFQIAMVIAHELSHSIDPCFIGYGPQDLGFKYQNKGATEKLEKQFPFRNVISCLRRSDSIGAKKAAGTFFAGYGHGHGAVGSSDGTKRVEPEPFCDADQITESFSDWLAMEILPSYIEKNHKLDQRQYQDGYANAYRMLCWQMDPNNPVGVHPNAAERINKIVLSQPKARGQMGCPERHSEIVYCDSEVELPAENEQRGTEYPAIPAPGAGGTQ